MAIRKIWPFTDTVAAQNSQDADKNLLDWDRKPGGGQNIDRVKKREAQGQKKTPIGAGTLKPTKR